ncbi:MAG: hypothetical protein ACI4PR_02010 [Acutalibacteraceae bacterium]
MNKSKILKMLEYCGMAYSDFHPVDEESKLVIIDDKKTDVQGFIKIKDDSATIVFRGSDSCKDWHTNFKFWKAVVPYGNYHSKIKVHSGFLSTYKSKNVRGKIHNIIKKHNIQNISVTGHSYGAALAILCAVDLEYNYPFKDYEVVVFGCPRVGNKAFRDSYNLRIFKTLRIETMNDFITKLPFKFLGYEHVGSVIKLKNTVANPFSNKYHALQEYYSSIWGV